MITPGRLSVILLAIAAGTSLLGWRIQASAAHDLEAAKEVQQRKVKESDAAPPSLDDNRAIIAILQESIGIRRSIEEQLLRIEDHVAALERLQGDAEKVSDTARTSLLGIGGALGGAVRAAESSVDRLGGLQRNLRKSALLGRAIAEELEELDRSLGPSVGRGRP